MHSLVHNAGFGVHGDFVDVPGERTPRMLRLNVTVLTELCSALVPAMVHRREGGVLNVASV